MYSIGCPNAISSTAHPKKNKKTSTPSNTPMSNKAKSHILNGS